MANADLGQLLTSLSLQSNERINLPQLPGVAPICVVAMPEERSADRWEEAFAKSRKYGYCALGVGSRVSVERLQEHIQNIDSWNHTDALRRADSFDLHRWFADRERYFTEEYGDLPLGDWEDPVEPPCSSLWFPFEDGVHLDPWWMAFIPAQQPWQAPLAVAFGNWNDCPDAVVHASLARHWSQQYGAQVAAVGFDTIEFLVERPPATREAAMKLAKEQYLYCPDIVDQGIDTISALGAALIDNSVWSFWWD